MWDGTTPLARAAALISHLARVTRGVLELARALHGAAGNGAVVAGNEVHQAEVQAFHGRQGGDVPHFAQGPVGFDQHVDGDAPFQADIPLDGL